MNKKFYLSVWRWHFFAGLYIVPFMLMLSITGLVMLAYPWIDSWQYGDNLTIIEAQASGPVPFEQQLKAVQSIYAESHVAQFVPPLSETHSSLFKVSGEAGTGLVFVNPYNAEVLGSFANADRLYSISDDIHGTLLLGKTGDALIELAAGLGFLLLMTGLYLHWPRGKAGLSSMLVPGFLKPSAWCSGKRAGWKDVHSSMGFYLSLFLVFFLLTGMAWTGIWGSKIVQPWNSFPAEKSASHWDSDASPHHDLNTDGLKEVPWNLELTPMPESSHNHEGAKPLSLDDVVAKAKTLGFATHYQGAFSNSFRIAMPKDETGVYTIMSVTMSRDATNPFGDRTVHLDQYSGEVLADIGWEDYNLVAKVMAAGIAFHMGSAGWWNVILAALVCVGIVLISITGVVLWWKRRSPSTSGLSAPAQQRLDELSGKQKGLIALMVLTGGLFPLAGAAMVVFFGIELLANARTSGAEQTA